MNTKQLWTALTLNPSTNKYFDGIYSSDTLKDVKEKPELIICNTDPSHKPGKHWLLFFFDGDEVDFYDSLGKDLTSYGVEFVNFANKYAKSINQCQVRTQPPRSSLCGQYCLYYAYLRCKGNTMEYIVNTMPSTLKVLSFICKHFYICNSYDCSLLQKCIKY